MRNERTNKNRRELVFGLIVTIYAVGLALTMLLLTILISAYIGDGNVMLRCNDYSENLLEIVFFSIIVLAGIVGAINLKEVKR